MKKFLKEFKAFISKGNVMDMAVGIIIGAAFQAVVKSLANDIIYPLVSSLIDVDFTTLTAVLKEAVVDSEGVVIKTAIELKYGVFIQNIVDFLIIALSIFVGLRSITGIKNVSAKHKAKYIKRYKTQHSESFEKNEYLKEEYAELKGRFPEIFKEELEEEARAKAEAEAIAKANEVVEPSTNDLLKAILESIQK